jgi:hypothetical protein
MKNNTPAPIVKTVGMSFSSLLTLLFITLKLTGVINWSWWLVLLPTLLPWTIVAIFFGWIGVLLLLVWWEGRKLKTNLFEEADREAARVGYRQTWAKGSRL